MTVNSNLQTEIKMREKRSTDNRRNKRAVNGNYVVELYIVADYSVYKL